MESVPERTIFAGFLVCAAVISLWFGSEKFNTLLSQASVRTQAAAVFFVESITVGQLYSAYGSPAAPAVLPAELPRKIKILIVPGHDPESGGTQFADYTERDIVVDISNDLAALLEKNPHYDVMVARSKTAWNPILSNYFNQHSADIDAFRLSQDALMQQYIADGKIIPEGSGQVDHHSVSVETADELYGINKWASENNIDITIHVHINDYPGRNLSQPGIYNGFAVYVPEHQYSNASASLAIGDAVAARLNAYHATSTMPEEAAGVIEDQQLIAVGSNNSADAASILVEYGYIYEPQFRDVATRSLAESDYANETYQGLQDFFNDSASSASASILPYVWSSNPTLHSTSPDLYALQTALHTAGYYPPTGNSFSDCPISGYFGDCTVSSLKQFEQTQNIPQTGLLDAPTRAALQSVLGGLITFPTP